MNSRRRRLAQTVALLCAPSSVVSLAGGSEVVYRRVATAKLAGTSKQSEVSAVPSELIRVFGEPSEETWDSESLGAFYFHGTSQEVFAVYYRAYDMQRTEKLKRSFWSRAAEVPFSIGAKTESGVPEFKAWLVRQLSGAA